MHPAVCNRIFGPKIDFVAIGLIGEFMEWNTYSLELILTVSIFQYIPGSSDIVNNLIIGFMGDSLLDSVGWSNYFICLTPMCGVIMVATVLFPREQKERTTTIVTAAASIAAATTGESVDLEATTETAAAAAAGTAITATVSTSTTPSLMYEGGSAANEFVLRGRRASSTDYETVGPSLTETKSPARRASCIIYENSSSSCCSSDETSSSSYTSSLDSIEGRPRQGQ